MRFLRNELIKAYTVHTVLSEVKERQKEEEEMRRKEMNKTKTAFETSSK